MSLQAFLVAMAVVGGILLFAAFRRWFETIVLRAGRAASPPTGVSYRPWYLLPVHAAPIARAGSWIDPVAWVASHVGPHVPAGTRTLLVELLGGPLDSSLREALVHQATQDPALVPALVAIARSADLWWADEDDPAQDAPERAIRLLGRLGAVETFEALVPLLALKEPWGDRLQELLAGEVFLRFGPALIPRIGAAMRDPCQPGEARGWLADALERMALHYPEERDTIVTALTALLEPDGEPLVNAQVALSLHHLNATDTYPTILMLARAGALESGCFASLDELVASLEARHRLEEIGFRK